MGGGWGRGRRGEASRGRFHGWYPAVVGGKLGAMTRDSGGESSIGWGLAALLPISGNRSIECLFLKLDI